MLVSSFIIHLFGLRFADPLAAVLISVLVIASSLRVIHGSSSIFLHQSPADTESISQEIRQIDGISTVDCIHVWSMCSRLHVATVNAERTKNPDKQNLQTKVHDILTSHDINHATVELQTDSDKQINSHTHH